MFAKRQLASYDVTKKLWIDFASIGNILLTPLASAFLAEMTTAALKDSIEVIHLKKKPPSLRGTGACSTLIENMYCVQGGTGTPKGSVSVFAPPRLGSRCILVV